MGMITRMVEERVREWDNFVQPTILAYNTSIHSTTKTSPFFLLYGRQCRLARDLIEYKPPMLKLEDSEVLSNLTSKIHVAQEKAREMIEEQQDRMKETQ